MKSNTGDIYKPQQKFIQTGAVNACVEMRFPIYGIATELVRVAHVDKLGEEGAVELICKLISVKDERLYKQIKERIFG
jgi:hypothetical protein